MEFLSDDIKSLNEALENQAPVVLEPDGFWYIEGSLKKRIRLILNLEENRIRSNAKSLVALLDKLETLPLNLNNEKQTFDYRGILHTAHLLLNQLKPFHGQDSVNTRNQLRRRHVALRYRLEGTMGGIVKAHLSEHNWRKLMEIANVWKKKQKIYADPSLGENECKRLEQSGVYPEFIDLLVTDKQLMNQFMKWIVRDNINPAPFIEYPAAQERIAESHLSGRIGRMGGEQLKIKKVGIEKWQQKILTLPFEGVDQSILDTKSIMVFPGNLGLTLEEVFDVFKNKNKGVGELEYMADGIVSWNVHRLGRWQVHLGDWELIDISQRTWWKQMPVFERLTRQEAENRYSRRLDDKQWVVAACASRGSMTLDYNSSHAFLEVAIPTNVDEYSVYNFGKFATYFPGSALDHMTFFCTTVYATVAYPDENVYYTHRQHANFAFTLSPEEGFKLMDSVRQDIQLSRERNFVYQIESENCAKWAHEKLVDALGHSRVPNLFVMPLLESEPKGVVNHVFKFIKSLPTAAHVPILTLLHKPLGAGKGVWIQENGQSVYKSLNNHEFWKTGKVFLPALLHKQKELEIKHGYVPVHTAEFFHAHAQHKSDWPPPPMVPSA